MSGIYKERQGKAREDDMDSRELATDWRQSRNGIENSTACSARHIPDLFTYEEERER